MFMQATLMEVSPEARLHVHTQLLYRLLIPFVTKLHPTNIFKRTVIAYSFAHVKQTTPHAYQVESYLITHPFFKSSLVH